MERLDKDLIADPSICNLLLRICPEQLDVAVYSVVSDNSFLHRSYSLISPTGPTMGMLEETIYDNPLLLSDFRRTYCIIEARRVLSVPSELLLQGHDALRRMFKMQWPDFDGEIIVDNNGTSNSAIVYGLERDLSRFLRRTFTSNLCIDSHLSSLLRYFAAHPGRSNTVRTIANLRENSLDMIALRGSHLLMANTFAFDKPADALYYILASRESLKLDPKIDEMLLAGFSPLREDLSTRLREYIARVMPVIFPPQMFKAGREALGAPFDMIVAPLCE